MSMQVLFNGSVLVRPGAATKIDASQFQNIALSGVGIVGLIGAADGGAPRTVQIFSDAKAVRDHYRSGPLVEGAQMLVDASNDPLIPGTPSQIVCYKTNNSEQASLAHDGKLTFTSVEYGLFANNVRVALTSTGGNERKVVITALDQFGVETTETSPSLCNAGQGKFTINYVGADAGAVTMTITATTLATTTSATPADDLALTFADFNNLQELLYYIDGLAAYTVVTQITNAGAFDPSNLDAVTTVDIKTGAYETFAMNYDLANWVNTSSSFVTCALTKGQAGPPAVLSTTALAGGTVGSADNTAWANAFTAMGTVDVNQVVPLASEDGAAPDTYTIASVNSALETHCRTLSGTAGKSERQGWASFEGTKTEVIAEANRLNSAHVQVVAQKPTRSSAVTNNSTEFGEWGLACILAGMRASAPLGEPLTNKFVKADSLSNDASWDDNETSDIADMILNGVMTVATIPGKGLRVEKGITTYTRSDNDAFTEESIVQGWKNISRELREELERKFIGRPGDAQVVFTVEPTVVAILEKLRTARQIADSVENGVRIPGYRDITVSLAGDVLSVGVTVSPTPGINFILNTLVLIPATFTS